MLSDPLFIVVAISVLVVLAVLLFGIGTFAKGGEFNRKYANKIMRYRILAQAIAVAVIPCLRLLPPHGGLSMVVLNKIYTRTGDGGDTALGNGTRIAKHSARVTAYGTVDEMNATVGLAALHAEGTMSAQLAMISERPVRPGRGPLPPGNGERRRGPNTLPCGSSPTQTDRLEAEIDSMNDALTPATQLHPARRLGTGRPPAPLPYRRTPGRTVGR